MKDSSTTPRLRALTLALVMVTLVKISQVQSVQMDEKLQASIFDNIHNLIFGSSSSAKSVKTVTTHKAASSSVAAVVESSSAVSYAPSFTVPVQKWFTVAGYRFPRTIRTGMLGDDVLNLQLILNRNVQTQMAKTGTESPGQETGAFDYKTRIGLIAFQKANLITAEQLTRLRREQGFAGLTTRVALEKVAKDLVAQGKLPSDTTNLHAAAQSAASSLRLVQSSRSSRSFVSVASTASEVTQTSSIQSQTSAASVASTAQSQTSTASQTSSIASTTSQTSSIASTASTSKSSAVSVASTAFTPNCGTGPTIHLTAACLQTINAPYLLNQPNATYILDTDVTVPETAFVIGAAGIVFDLNNHTITYGNANPVSVTNGSFENGTTGWDLSRAPTAVIKPALSGMWGNSMLTFVNATSTQIITSDPITLPTLNHAYAATIANKGPSGVTATLRVIDTVTNQVLASGVGNPSRGMHPVAKFTPVTANPVRLEYELSATPAKPATMNVDYAAIFLSSDHGIVASLASSSQFGPQLKPIISAANRKAANFTVKNGSIVQGKARSYNGTALMLDSLPGGTVQHVSTLINGMDTVNLNAFYGSNYSITDSTFDANVDIIASRFDLFSAIRMWNATGINVINGNTIKNTPEMGISLIGITGITVTNNDISQRTIVSNGYGIGIRGLNDSTIAHNRIVTTQGRGFLIEAGGSDISKNLDIHDNYIDVQEGPNLEYNVTGINTQALRIRNYDKTISNLHIHDNTFIVSTGPGKLAYANTAHITLENDVGQTTDSHNVIENNIFRAIVNTTDTTYGAVAMGISMINGKTGITFLNNDFQSNDTSLAIGDDLTSKTIVEDILFQGNTMTHLTDASRTYTSIRVGDGHFGSKNIQMIDTKYVNGATPAMVFKFEYPKEMKFGNLLTINTIANASVQITDAQGTVVYTGTADASGTISNIPVVHTTYQQTGSDPKIVTTVHNAPLQISVTGNGKTVTQSTDMTQNTTLTFNMQ